jgi:predicted Holliday junction resolvase-like endonuclease
MVMSIGHEFFLSLLVQLLILAFFVGVYVTTIKFMGNKIEEIKEALKDDKKELKEEMKRYNNVLERMIINEQSVKSAHHRIDSLEDIIK